MHHMTPLHGYGTSASHALKLFWMSHMWMNLSCKAERCCAGLGKTTLAHVAARHCGYRPLEINASDDRGAATLTRRVADAAEMAFVLGARQPNCVIIDEIDGAMGAPMRASAGVFYYTSATGAPVSGWIFTSKSGARALQATAAVGSGQPLSLDNMMACMMLVSVARVRAGGAEGIIRLGPKPACAQAARREF